MREMSCERCVVRDVFSVTHKKKLSLGQKPDAFLGMPISGLDYRWNGPRSRRRGVAGSGIGKDHSPLSEITSDLGPAIRIGGHVIQTHGPAGDKLRLTVAASKVFGLSDSAAPTLTSVSTKITSVLLDRSRLSLCPPIMAQLALSDEHLYAAEFQFMVAEILLTEADDRPPWHKGR
jgi:hypothetical protein